MATTLGTLNPFRYRGYVYDEETGLYYLRSRCYNPEWSRFVNADVVYRGSVYAYCNNCPVVRTDKDGYAAMMCYFDDMGLGNLMVGAMSYGGSGGLGSATVNDIIAEYRNNASPKAGSPEYPPLNLSLSDFGNALVGWVNGIGLNLLPALQLQKFPPIYSWLVQVLAILSLGLL